MIRRKSHPFDRLAGIDEASMHGGTKPVSSGLSAAKVSVSTYIKIHTWLRGEEEGNIRSVLFIAEPQDDFFCFIPPSLGAQYEYQYIEISLLRHVFLCNSHC